MPHDVEMTIRTHDGVETDFGHMASEVTDVRRVGAEDLNDILGLVARGLRGAGFVVPELAVVREDANGDVDTLASSEFA